MIPMLTPEPHPNRGHAIVGPLYGSLRELYTSFRTCVMRRSSLCSAVAEEPYSGLAARSAAKEQSLTSQKGSPSCVFELLGYQGQLPLTGALLDDRVSSGWLRAGSGGTW
jgi:hypothetical protein